MVCVSLVSRNWLAAFALTLAGASGATGVAQAADFYEPEVRRPPVEYQEYGYARPRYAPPVVAEGAEACRVIHKRHIDPYGREIVRRVRVCEEDAVAAHPRWAYRAPRHDYGYGNGYEPDPYDVPRPPRVVGSPYDDDQD